jgi:hypothetical protein
MKLIKVVNNIINQSVVSGRADASSVTRATYAAAVAMEPHLQQTSIPTDDSTTTTEATDLT